MVIMRRYSVPDVGIVHQEQSTEIFIKETSCGMGTLYITESKVLWLTNEGNGLTFDYPTISIHAISRDTSTFPHECLFMILDISVDEEENMEDDGDDDDGSQANSTEVRFVPSQKEHLNEMYQAMCACQELHPDAEQEDSDNEFYGEEELIGDGPRLSAQGLSNMARMEQMLSANGDVNGTAASDPDDTEEMEEGQFEDA